MYATAVDVLVFLCRLDLGSLLVKIFLYRWFSFSSAGLTDPLCSLPGQAPKKATAGKGGDIFWAHPQEIDSCRPVSFFFSFGPFRFPVTKIKKKKKSRSGLGKSQNVYFLLPSFFLFGHLSMSCARATSALLVFVEPPIC